MENASHVLPVHCVTHKLGLTVLGTVNSRGNFEHILKTLIFKFYHYSLKMRNIFAIFDANDIFVDL